MSHGFDDLKNMIEMYSKEEADLLLADKANTASPTFTGTPKAPTPANTSSNTTIATTAFVKALLDMIYPVGILVAVPGNYPESGQIPAYGTWEKLLSTTYYVWDIDKSNGYPVTIWRRKS